MESPPQSSSSTGRRVAVALSGAAILALSVQCSGGGAPPAGNNVADNAFTDNIDIEPLPFTNALDNEVGTPPPPEPVAIEQGVVDVLSSAERVAPLRITTPPGDISYFVKLVDADSSSPIMTLFIRGGQTFQTRVPLGRVKIRYASGEIWQGPEALFGPDTYYQEADQTFEFVEDSEGVSGYEINLIRQEGGNMDSRSIPGSQF